MIRREESKEPLYRIGLEWAVQAEQSDIDSIESAVFKRNEGRFKFDGEVIGTHVPSAPHQFGANFCLSGLGEIPNTQHVTN